MEEFWEALVGDVRELFLSVFALIGTLVSLLTSG